ncbi:MAG TPA: tetratricopeptide repeat protein [Bryobacteraceae bacterium]|jgi:tetratricopeptide (TPR) repeat protein|nr:tetratricopeptide repeat protein [Bryobacteraceae bacterium]
MFLATYATAQFPLQQAAEEARQGHYREARKLLQGVPEPGDLNQQIAFHRLKAAIATGLNEPAAALHEIKTALALAPGNPNLVLAVAVAELRAGKTEDALSHAQTAPESATREALLGDIQEKRGNVPQAIAAYEAAVRLAPDQERYALALGLELTEHQDFAKAVESLQSSAVRFPKSAKIQALLGIAQYAQGYPEDAIGSLERAIAADPKFPGAYGVLAKIVLQSSAAPPPRVVQDLCSWNRVVCGAVQLRIARQRGDSALQARSLAELKLAGPRDPIGRCELARAYEWTGELQQARREMEACVELDPSPQNHYRLGLLYRKLGLTDSAQKEMAQRNATLQRMSEQTALGLQALQALGGLSTEP